MNNAMSILVSTIMTKFFRIENLYSDFSGKRKNV